MKADAYNQAPMSTIAARNNPRLMPRNEQAMIASPTAMLFNIPAGAWVLLRTDWSKRKDPKEYINLKEDGPHTPGLAKESSVLLAQERDVLGVGVETVGTDAGQAATFDPPFPNHYLMHGSGKFGLAGLSNLDQLPATGAIVIAAP